MPWSTRRRCRNSTFGCRVECAGANRRGSRQETCPRWEEPGSLWPKLGSRRIRREPSCQELLLSENFVAPGVGDLLERRDRGRPVIDWLDCRVGLRRRSFFDELRRKLDTRQNRRCVPFGVDQLPLFGEDEVAHQPGIEW